MNGSAGVAEILSHGEPGFCRNTDSVHRPVRVIFLVIYIYIYIYIYIFVYLFNSSYYTTHLTPFLCPFSAGKDERLGWRG